MAFTFRNAKNINVEDLFDIKKAYLYAYSDAMFPHYKKSKLIVTFPSKKEQPAVPQHYFSGHVIEETLSVDRKVNIHRCDTGELVGTTTSSGAGGYFYGKTTYSGAHYVVCLDDEAGKDYNALIYGNIYPVTISG